MYCWLPQGAVPAPGNLPYKKLELAANNESWILRAVRNGLGGQSTIHLAKMQEEMKKMVMFEMNKLIGRNGISFEDLRPFAS